MDSQIVQKVLDEQISAGRLHGKWYFFYRCHQAHGRILQDGNMRVGYIDINGHLGRMSMIPVAPKIAGTVHFVLDTDNDDDDGEVEIDQRLFGSLEQFDLGDNDTENAWQLQSVDDFEYDGDHREWTVWLSDVGDDSDNESSFLVLEWMDKEDHAPVFAIAKRGPHEVTRAEKRKLGIGLSDNEVEGRAMRGTEDEEEECYGDSEESDSGSPIPDTESEGSQMTHMSGVA